MKIISQFTAVFVLIVVVANCAVAADSSASFKPLQGTWLPVKADLGGKPMAPEVLNAIILKIDNDTYEVIVAGHPDNGTLTIDTAAKPKGMTVVGVKGPNAGKTFPAIYELKDDSLRICYDLSGEKRPTEFKSSAGTKLYLVDYKRKK